MKTTNRVWVAATLDTKSDETIYVCTLLEAAGVPVTLADLSTSGSSVPAATRVRISPEDIAAYHPQSRSAVFTGDRGTAMAGMSDAWIGALRLPARPDDPRDIVVVGDTGCRMVHYDREPQRCLSAIDWPASRRAWPAMM